jgi:phosphoglycolate phosphatase
MRANFQSLVFDFDYTLVDSSKGVVECVNYALEGLGLSPAAPELIYQTIGMSLPVTLMKLTGNENDEKSPEFIRLFTKRADEIMVQQTIMFTNVPSEIQRLKQINLMLGIVSTKYRYRIEEILKREHLFEAFTVIIGGEDVAQHKPDPTGLQKAIEKLNNSPSQVLYIGDSLVDAETANRAGVSFVAILSGMAKREDFIRFPVLEIFENMKQMTDWLVN